MSTNLSTRIIDGDGHIMEDNAGIIAHMEGAYREIAARKGTVSRRWTICTRGAQSKPRRSVTSALRWAPKVGSSSSTTSASTGP